MVNNYNIKKVKLFKTYAKNVGTMKCLWLEVLEHAVIRDQSFLQINGMVKLNFHIF